MVSDFPKDGKTLEEFRQGKVDKVSGQGVSTFVSDTWTLEYDLADTELAEEVYVAAKLAQADEKICDGVRRREDVEREAREIYASIPDDAERASKVYAEFAHKTKITASKAIAAQYVAELLETKIPVVWAPGKWEAVLPAYLVDAIKHVTPNADAAAASPRGEVGVAGDDVPEQPAP